MAVYLEPLGGGKQIVLDKAVTLIGRQTDCDVILTQSRKVSRKHCCIAQVNDRYIVRDLASMNGVRVNGQRIDRESPLRVGDELAVADVRYVMRDSRAEAEEPAEASSEDEDVASPPAASSPSAPAGDSHASNRGPVDRPAENLSQKFPVPIDDEGIDFAVEPKSERLRHSSEPDDTGGEAAAPDGFEILPEEPADEGVDDLLPLEDSSEFGQSGSNR